jgi:hypothetical protein
VSLKKSPGRLPATDAGAAVPKNINGTIDPSLENVVKPFEID